MWACLSVRNTTKGKLNGDYQSEEMKSVKVELKDKLKKVAANLGEDSNPVIMLVKHKK